MDIEGCNVSFTDNFLTLTVTSDSPDVAFEQSSRMADSIVQILSIQYGTRFTASFLLLDDEKGIPQQIRQRNAVAMMNLTFYNIEELKDRLNLAIPWSTRLDDRSRKALLYFEHACLQHQFAQTLPFLGPHAAFAHAVAFLQLFKALVVLVGEPGVDSDYQRRGQSLGLGADFWQTKVRPLYDVRNDEDVAHYRISVPTPGAMLQRFAQAAGVLRDAFAAYMTSTSQRRDA
jgi:hypothetical protein